MSHSATYTWVDPPQKFNSVELDLQVSGAPSPTVVGTAAPGAQSFVIGGLADGDYVFGATWINGTARSSRATFSATISTAPPADVPPDPGTNFSVAIAAE